MTIAISGGAPLSDKELLLEVKRLACLEQQATSHLIGALGELDARRLYLAEGCSSLFGYCTEILHLSEHAAYLRIETARAARKWPVILELIADGSLHLTAVSLLAPHITDDNHGELLAGARHKSKRAVEEIVASLRPGPAVRSSVRELPVPKATSSAEPLREAQRLAPSIPASNTSCSAPRDSQPQRCGPSAVKPLAPERYKVQFTISRETHDRLREAQDLLRHRIPNGDVGAIFDRALALLLTELHRSRHGHTDRPRAQRPNGSRSRHIPAAVKREVWNRDEGRCAFVGTHGRCTERGFLEYHHVVPYADDGPATAGNLELHNAARTTRTRRSGGSARARMMSSARARPNILVAAQSSSRGSPAARGENQKAIRNRVWPRHFTTITFWS